MIEINTLSCALCGVALKSSHPESPLSGEDIKQSSWQSAVVDEVVAGFGSKFDTCGFAVGFCDSCLEKAVLEGRIVKVYDGLSGGYNFDCGDK